MPIAAGVGGGVFVLLVIIIGCCCCKSNDKIGAVAVIETEGEMVNNQSDYGTTEMSYAKKGPQTNPKLDP